MPAVSNHSGWATLRRSGLDRASRNTKPPGLHHCWDVSQPTSLPRPQCLKNMNRSQAIGYASRVLWSLRVSRLAGSPCVGQVSTELHATQNRRGYVTAGTCPSLRQVTSPCTPLQMKSPPRHAATRQHGTLGTSPISELRSFRIDSKHRAMN